MLVGETQLVAEGEITKVTDRLTCWEGERERERFKEAWAVAGEVVGDGDGGVNWHVAVRLEDEMWLTIRIVAAFASEESKRLYMTLRLLTSASSHAPSLYFLR